MSACSSDAGATGEPESINVALANHTWTTEIVKLIPEFEKETGISVNVTTYGEDQLSDQYNVKLNARSSDLDVLMHRPPQEGNLFANNGWLKPLDEYVAEDADWNWDDFQEGPREAVTVDGSIYSVPHITSREVLYYRKDLLEAANIDVPTTLAELEEAVKTVHDPDNGVYGFVARGARAAAVTQFSSFLYSFGGSWDEDGTATLNTDEAKEAFSYYGNLLRNYGPPGTTNMNWPEAMAIFGQGKAAFYTDGDDISATLLDPTKSKVQDTVGYAAFPAGPMGAKPYSIATWSLGINEYSKKADAAWEFIHWATAAENMLTLQQLGISGSRTSVWENPDGISGFPAELAEAMRINGEVGVGYDRPQVMEVSKARDIVGEPIVISIDGGDVDAATEKANSAYQELLDSQRN